MALTRALSNLLRNSSSTKLTKVHSPPSPAWTQEQTAVLQLASGEEGRHPSPICSISFQIFILSVNLEEKIYPLNQISEK